MAGNCLTLADRREIERLCAADEKPSVIAAAVGVSVATIYRELKRGETGGLNRNYNHAGKVVARLRNKTLALDINERGVDIEANLGGTTAGRELYEEIDGGYVDKMSFSFTVREAKYDSTTHTRTITKVKKLYDVSAVDIPAYNETSIAARGFFPGEDEKELAALGQARRRKGWIALTD